MISEEILAIRGRSYPIRVYAQSVEQITSHGYCVDDFPSNVSLVVGELFLDPSNTKFKDLRPMIEYSSKTHMNKRSIMFQEVLFIMSRLPNIYGIPKEERVKYLFGFISKDDGDLIIIPKYKEDEFLNAILPNISPSDMAIVPYSQIKPNEDYFNEVDPDEDVDESPENEDYIE